MFSACLGVCVHNNDSSFLLRIFGGVIRRYRSAASSFFAVETASAVDKLAFYCILTAVIKLHFCVVVGFVFVVFDDFTTTVCRFGVIKSHPPFQIFDCFVVVVFFWGGSEHSRGQKLISH